MKTCDYRMKVKSMIDALSTAEGAVRLQDGIWYPLEGIASAANETSEGFLEIALRAREEGELEPEVPLIVSLPLRDSSGRTAFADFVELGTVLAVGYRLKGESGKRFRRTAGKLLSEFLRKGFVLDDERLKNTGTSAEDLQTRVKETDRRTEFSF